MADNEIQIDHDDDATDIMDAINDLLEQHGLEFVDRTKEDDSTLTYQLRKIGEKDPEPEPEPEKTPREALIAGFRDAHKQYGYKVEVYYRASGELRVGAKPELKDAVVALELLCKAGFALLERLGVELMPMSKDIDERFLLWVFMNSATTDCLWGEFVPRNSKRELIPGWRKSSDGIFAACANALESSTQEKA